MTRPIRWCARCVLPDTRPNLGIGDDGICEACRNHGARVEVDWDARAAAFEGVVARARSLSQGYDCLIPVSGGKDSTWQVVRALELGLRPLAVSWKPPARSAIGWQNLENLISLGVDHIDFQVNPKVERKFLLAAFERYGATAVPMHMAMFNIPLSLAVRFRIPLVLWGENSAVEYGGADDESSGMKMDRAWLRRFGVTHGTTAEDWVSDELSADDLTPYHGPTDDELEEAGVLAAFLGYYFPWDPETSLRVAGEHGFRARAEGPKTGLYDYADIDDDFISIHHWMKWYKFGFTRLFDNLSLEIRNGRMTRDEALDTFRAMGIQRPDDDIERFCSFVGITRARFEEIAETHRNLDVWEQRDGLWVVPGFILDDWDWSA